MLNEIMNQTIEIPYVGIMSVGTLLLILIGILIVKGLALWKSATQNQKSTTGQWPERVITPELIRKYHELFRGEPVFLLPDLPSNYPMHTREFPPSHHLIIY